MKTPDEIKKGLMCTVDSTEGCYSSKCPYRYGFCTPDSNIEVRTDALAYIQQLEAKVPKWISVDERLPESTMPPHDVLVYHNVGGIICIDRAWYSYNTYKWRSCLGNNLKVTHWMPLPEQPVEV